METYTDFESDPTNMNFDFLQFEDDENIHEDTSSITQVCVDHHDDNEDINIDVDSTNANEAVDLLQSTSESDENQHTMTNRCGSANCRNDCVKMVKTEQDAGNSLDG